MNSKKGYCRKCDIMNELSDSSRGVYDIVEIFFSIHLAASFSNHKQSFSYTARLHHNSVTMVALFESYMRSRAWVLF